MPGIVVDTETTGLSNEDRIVEIAIVCLQDLIPPWQTLINPEIPIKDEAAKVHGITNDKLEGQPTFREVANYVQERIHESDAVIGQNPWFDIRMLDGEFSRLGIVIKWPKVICTKRIWDIYEPKEKRNLQGAYKRFVNRDGFDGAHGALADTLACRDVLLAQMKEFNLGDKKWDELDKDGEAWYGSSAHIIWEKGDLILNFGKHKGTKCVDVTRGYWSWIGNSNFPEHVKEISDYMIGNPNATAADLASWAYGKRK